MASLQRTNQSGGMVPNRQIRGAILPWEKQLIDALGLTLEEYNWYANQVANYRPERDAAYDIVPHVQCTGFETFLATTIVGIALSAASSALAPKPKLPKRSDPAQQQGGGDLTGASVNAENRFTNVDGFTSVQPLARLGEVMPLVFADRQSGLGGVRVETKLLWSQLLSQGDGQELIAVLLAGAGVLNQTPDIKGFAIGDSLIRGYQPSKFAVYFKPGAPDEGRLKSGNRIGGELRARGIDAFSTNVSNIGMQPIFSGVRIPTTMTQFGTYQPLRNGQSYRLPFKRVRVSFPLFVNPGPGADIEGVLREWQKDQEAANRADIERNKIQSAYACWTGITKINGADHGLGFQDVNVSVGDTIQFDIVAGNVPNSFDTFGVQDIATKDDNYRLSCDEILSVGETYLIGNVGATCTSVYPTDAPFEPTASKSYGFTALTAGTVRRVSTQILAHNPDFNSTNLGNTVNPCTGSTISKLAVAHITTTRRLNQIEIGLKSRVYKQFTGIANFSSIPDESTLAALEAGGNNFNVGQYSDYGVRYSFFQVQIRESGAEGYSNLSETPFAVKGRTPVDQFNFIRINFPNSNKQYEIRLRPVAGATVLASGITARILSVTGLLKSYNVDGHTVSYRGYEEFITQLKGTNSVMFFGGKPAIGAVKSLGAVNYITNGEQELATFATTTVSGPGSGLTVSVVAKEVRSTQKQTAIAKDGFQMKWLHMAVLEDANGNHAPEPTGLGQRFTGRATYSYAPPGVDLGFPQLEVQLDLTSALTTAFGVQQGYTAGGFMWSCSAVPGAVITDTGNSADPMASGQYAFKKPAGVAMPPSNFEYSLLDLTTSEQVIYTAYVVPQNPGSGYSGGSYSAGSSVVRVQGIGISLSDLTVQEIVPPSQRESVAEDYDAVADVYLYDQQEGSHQNEPEHQVVYINEQRVNEIIPQYDNMALIGLQLRSGKEWNDFTNFSYYAKQGCRVTKLVNSGSSATNLFPEILLHLLRAPLSGAGSLVPDNMIDYGGFTRACQMCLNNKLFYDGVIGAPVNVRDWAYEHASYFFLDFLILGGKISLQPTFPGESLYGANVPQISALFTDGNIIKDSLQVSWYPQEQRTPPQVLITIRDEVENGFAETRNILVRPNIANYESLQVEAVDFTGFCTSATHAVDFAKLLIQTRRFVTHTVTFKTFPEGLALAPGAYFKLTSAVRHANSFQNGYVLNSGQVISSSVSSPSQQVYWWQPEFNEVQEGTMVVDANGFTSATFAGAVFTTYTNDQSESVYKAEIISYDEEGMVEITGTHVPLDSGGGIAYLNLSDSQFVVENEQ